MHCKLLLSALILALGAQSVSAQEAARIGTTASATDDVQGRRGSAQRQIKVGDGVFREEEIRTGQAARAQVLFRDETVLSMGPNSVVVLDKFVYDPDKKAGEMTLKAVTGAFRFVSGSAPSQNYKIDTAVGTIGVRGTDIGLKVEGVGESVRVFLTLYAGTFSQFCATPTTCTTLKPGEYLVNRGGITTSPLKVGDASCGGKPCRDKPNDNPWLVREFLSDVKNLPPLPPAAGPTQAGPSRGPSPPPCPPLSCK